MLTFPVMVPGWPLAVRDGPLIHGRTSPELLFHVADIAFFQVMLAHTETSSTACVCMRACLPACLPACPPACLPACLHACMHAGMYDCKEA